MLLALLALACTTADTDPVDTGDGTASGPATYRAEALIGALDRIHVVRETADLCVALGLVSPGGAPPIALQVPDPWAVEFAWGDRRLDAQPCWTEAPAEPAWCHDGEGSVAFPGWESGYPQILTVDATLRWPADRPGWMPESVGFKVEDLAVSME